MGKKAFHRKHARTPDGFDCPSGVRGPKCLEGEERLQVKPDANWIQDEI